ncbi:hypothetical protein CapIbe_004072 [Capra ibex]
MIQFYSHLTGIQQSDSVIRMHVIGLPLWLSRPEAAVRRARCLPDEHLVRNTESSTWLSFAQKPLLGSEPLLYLKQIFTEWT